MNNKVISLIGAILITVGFLCIYGFVGSLDNDAIAFGKGLIGILSGFVIMVCGGLVSSKGGSRVD